MAWPCSRRRRSRARRHLRGRNGDEARCPSSDDRWCSSDRGLVRAALDGFTLHASTRAGGHDEVGREALLKCAHLASAVAQERVTRGPDGLVRITLKKPFSDGTVAVESR